VLVLAAATVIAATTALAFADPPLLSDFGIVASIDVALVLAATAIVLPATLAWAEQRSPLRLPRSRAELAALARRSASTVRAGVAWGAGRARALGARVRRPRRRRRARRGGETGQSLEP
jgi:uncharacterized membrane protein YdfJ with MMPL/SSD domain